ARRDGGQGARAVRGRDRLRRGLARDRHLDRCRRDRRHTTGEPPRVRRPGHGARLVCRSGGPGGARARERALEGRISVSLRLATLMVASAVVHGAALTAPFAVRREPPAIVVELAPRPLPATAAAPAPRRGDPASPPARVGRQAAAELPPAPETPTPVWARSDPAALPDEPAPPRSLPMARMGAPDLASPAASRRIPLPPLDVGRPLLADGGSPSAPAPVARDAPAPGLPGPGARRLASPGAPGRPSLPAPAMGPGPGDSALTAGDRGREAQPTVGVGAAGIPPAAIARLIGSRSGGGDGARGEAPGAGEGSAPTAKAPTSIAGAPEGGDERGAPAASGDPTRAADPRAGAREGVVGRSGSAPVPRARGNPSPLAVAGAVGPGPAASEYGPYLW